MTNHDFQLTLAHRMSTLPSSCVRELMKTAGEGDIISFAGGVVFAPGESFSPDGHFRHALRLNFTNATAAAIERGIAVLAEEVKRLL